MKRPIGLVLILTLIATVFFSLDMFGREYRWILPENMPVPVVPPDNPMTITKVELGRWLFYDTRLSVNKTMSCGSCHVQHLAFTDGRGNAVGVTGERHPRGSMSLVNTAYASRLTWANHLLDRLEVQVLIPLFNETPVEMGMAGREHEIIQLLRTDSRYKDLLPEAFPRDEDPYSLLNAVRGISSFVRSVVSFNAPYDRYLRGDKGALSVSAQRGMSLFFSEKTECFHCHGGFNFTDSSTHSSSTIESVGFHNNGLYNIGAHGGYPSGNTGLHELTGERRDMGRFKAPTLRNIAITAPYMHDGSIGSLGAVLDHYQQGGRTIEGGTYTGHGSRNPYKSVFVRRFELTATERRDLLNFFEALTDETVLKNPSLSDPWLEFSE